MNWVSGGEFQEIGEGRSGRAAITGQAVLSKQPIDGVEVLRFKAQARLKWSINPAQPRRGGRMTLEGTNRWRALLQHAHRERRQRLAPAHPDCRDSPLRGSRRGGRGSGRDWRGLQQWAGAARVDVRPADGGRVRGCAGQSRWPRADVAGSAASDRLDFRQERVTHPGPDRSSPGSVRPLSVVRRAHLPPFAPTHSRRADSLRAWTTAGVCSRSVAQGNIAALAVSTTVRIASTTTLGWSTATT